MDYFAGRGRRHLFGFRDYCQHDLQFLGHRRRLQRNKGQPFTALGKPDCLTREEIIAEAQSRGWDVQDQEEFRWHHSPDGLQDWLRVSIDPPLFMSTEDENAAFFGFDDEGCSVEWSYTFD
ncbi:MAG: hypothetical protein GY947_13440 [Rhodobacteraceae bacterium]|nr:hypothetical protein [Paracoccaceae bacterium]